MTLEKNVVYRCHTSDGLGVWYWWIPDNPKTDLGAIKVTFHGGTCPSRILQQSCESSSEKEG